MLRFAALAVLLLLSACRTGSSAPPETAADLVERMLARFNENVGDASGFSVLLGGYEVRYTLATDSAAAERFAVAIAPTDSASVDPLVQTVVTGYLPNVPLLAAELGAAPLGEAFERDGARVYALDASRVVADSTLEGSTNLVVYVDARTFQVREVARTVRLDSLARPLASRQFYDDFRTADGVTLPWRLRVVQDGLDQLVDPTMRMVEGGQLTFRREQLRQAPPSPARDVELAGIERRLRMMTQGTEETTVMVRRVTVQRATR